MTARWVGLLTVGASLILGPAVARAGTEKGRSSADYADEHGWVSATGEEDELVGRVMKSEANTLYVEHMGAVFPVQIGRDTRFFGVRSADHLTEGQEVRVSFTKDDGKNVAHRISLIPPTRAPEPPPVEFTDRG